MAFEAITEAAAAGGRFGEPRRRFGGQRVTTLVSALLHGLAVLGAIAYSYWHVEELSPPSVTVTFVGAAAPPPPPPPPAALGGGNAAAAAAKKRLVVPPKAPSGPKPVELVQPPKPQEVPVEAPPPPAAAGKDPEPKVADAPAGAGTPSGVKGGVAGGVPGGVSGGTVGGQIGGTPGAPSAPSVPAKFLPPQMGAQQKLAGRDPDMPALLRTPGAKFEVKAKVCVRANGAVDSVVVLKRAHPMLDGNVVTAVSGWRFRPLLANGTPVPFCYFANFDFRAD